jgi:hypothetical protein
MDVTELDAWYRRVAGAALDRVDELGQCNVVHVDDVDGLRRAMRADARHRGVKIRTWATSPGTVIVVGTEPSILAEVWRAATTPLVVERLSIGDDDPAGRAVDPNAHVVDAGEPAT